MLNTTKTNGKVVVSRVNQKAYARLLVNALPSVIETEAQNQRAIAIMRTLMNRPRTPEETQLLRLLSELIGSYERRAYPGDVEPREHLAGLMEERGIKRADLLPIFKSRSAISEVLSGKRGISRNQVKMLAEFFSVPVSLFL